MKQLKDLLKTEMNGESVRRHVYLLTEKMTADDDDNQDVLFDFNADLIGTGSIPICM